MSEPESAAAPAAPPATEPESPPAPRTARKARRTLRRLLDRAARLSAGIDTVCAAHGITRDQYEVLRVLGRAGAEGLSRSGISRKLPSRAPDVTRLLDRLARKSLVARGRSGTDRRQRVTTLTDEGAELLRRVEAEVDAVLAGFAAPLRGRELRRLGKLLRRL